MELLYSEVIWVGNLSWLPNAIISRVFNKGSLPLSFVLWVLFSWGFPFTTSWGILAFGIINLCWCPLSIFFIIPVLWLDWLRVINFFWFIIQPSLLSPHTHPEPCQTCLCLDLRKIAVINWRTIIEACHAWINRLYCLHRQLQYLNAMLNRFFIMFKTIKLLLGSQLNIVAHDWLWSNSLWTLTLTRPVFS